MKRFLSLTLAIVMVLASFTFVSAASYADISTVASAAISEAKYNPPLDYKVGDDIEFYFQLKSGSETVIAPYISYVAVMDDGRRLSGYVAPTDGVYTVTLTGGLLRPGFVMMSVKACDENRNVISTVPVYMCGAGADIHKINSIYDVPDAYDEFGDFNEFWDETLAQLEGESGKAELQYIYHLGTITKGGLKYDYYEVEISCPTDDYYNKTEWCGTNHVFGYLTVPQTEQEESLGFYLDFKGYDRIIPERELCKEGFIALSVSPHSVPAPHNVAEADKASAYVSDGAYTDDYYNVYLENAYGYSVSHGKDESDNASPHTSYFKYMLLRDVQAVNFLKRYFGSEAVEGQDEWAGLWNGTDIYTKGPSQGGFQALSVAGLVPEVNNVSVDVPWFADQGVTSEDSDRYIPVHPRNFPYSEALRYLDTANIASRISRDCTVTIRAGLIDTLVPPSTVMSIYNNLECNAELTFYQKIGHSIAAAPYTQGVSKNAVTGLDERVVSFADDVNSEVYNAFVKAWEKVSGETVVNTSETAPSVEIYVADKNSEIDFVSVSKNSTAEAVGVILTGEGLTEINAKLAEIYALHNDSESKLWIISNSGVLDAGSAEQGAIALDACMHRGGRNTSGGGIKLYGSEGERGGSFILTANEPYAVIPSPLWISAQGILTESENILLQDGLMSSANSDGRLTLRSPAYEVSYETVGVGDAIAYGDIESVGIWSLSADGVLNIRGKGEIPSYESYSDSPWSDFSITSVDISEGITAVGSNAFSGMDGSLVEIPLSVKNIKANAIGIGCSISGYDNSYVKSFAEENGYVFNNLGGYGVCGDELYWHFDLTSGVFTVDGSGTDFVACDDEGNKLVCNYDGTGLEERSYARYIESIKEIHFKAPITTIPKYTFRGSVNCTLIELPASFTGGGEIWFNGLTSLSTVYTEGQIPEAGTANLSNLTYIAPYAFEKVKKFTKVIFNEDLKEIPTRAFFENAITSLELPENLRTIGKEAFAYCSKLTELTLPQNVSAVDATAFKGNTKISELTVLNTELDISGFAANLSGLKKIISHKNSLSEAYANEKGIEFEVYEEQKELIATGACGDKLNYRILLDRFGIYSMEIYGEGTATKAKNKDTGAYFTSDSYNGYVASNNYLSSEHYQYASLVSKIKFDTPNLVDLWGYFFKDFTASEVELHPNMKKLAQDSFNGMKALSTIYTSGAEAKEGVADLSNLTDIGNYTFQKHKFKRIILGDSLTYVGTSTFASDYGASVLEMVEIPRSVTELNKYAFRNATKLICIKFDNDSFTYAAEAFEGMNKNATVIASASSTGAAIATSKSLQLIDPTEISELVSAYENGNSSVIIAKKDNDNYTAIASGTATSFSFGHSDYNTAIANLTRAWDEYKTKITKVVYVNPKLTKIDASFARHSNLITVEIPASLTELGSNCFNGSPVRTMYIKGNEAKTGVVDARNITVLGEMAFASCGASSILLSDSLNSILGDYMFYKCSELEYIRIPESVSTLAKRTFGSNVPKLRSILIENPLAAIGSEVFEGARNLEYIIGYSGSTAESFAKENGYEFIPIDASGALNFTGFQIREDEYNGLRSLYTADLSAMDEREKAGLKIVEFGSILASADWLSEEGAELTVWTDETGEVVTHSFAEIKAVMKNGERTNNRILSTSTDSSIDFACTVIDFDETNYNLEITFRGYIVLEDKDGNRYYEYADLCDADGSTEDENGKHYGTVSLDLIVSRFEKGGADLTENITYLNVMDFRK